jgi:hypothetical protein
VALSAGNYAIFLSSAPSDEQAAQGWRQPKTALGHGKVPVSDEDERFQSHPWAREIRQLVARWFKAAAGACLALLLLTVLLKFFPENSAVRWMTTNRVHIVGFIVLGVIALFTTVTFARRFNAGAEHYAHYLDYSTHEDAVVCLKRYLNGGEPYAVYFRSFALEAGVFRFPDKKQVTYVMPPLQFETQLADALRAEGLSVIALDNPADIMRHRKPPIPRLCVPPDEWLDWLQDLIWAASLVVIYCDAVSEGILEELRLIALLKQQPSTIVVLSTDTQTADHLTNIRAAAIGGGATFPEYRPLSADAPILKEFQYVLREDEVDFTLLTNTPGFRELIPEARQWRLELKRRLSSQPRFFLNLIPVDRELVLKAKGDPEQMARAVMGAHNFRSHFPASRPSPS